MYVSVSKNDKLIRTMVMYGVLRPGQSTVTSCLSQCVSAPYHVLDHVCSTHVSEEDGSVSCHRCHRTDRRAASTSYWRLHYYPLCDCETAKPSLEDALTEDVKTISGHVLSCIGSCENQQKWSTSYWKNVLKKNGPTKCPRVQ